MDLELEQLVYGSFPFRAGGYDVLARSGGCSAAVVAEVVAVCRRYGQPPSGEAARPGLFALRLPSGPWAVVAVAPQGSDDRGRPGALAFHALIVPRRDYWRAGADPFAFAAAHRGDWSAATPNELPRVRCTVGQDSPVDRPIPELRTRRIAEAITQRRRIALEAPGPVDALAREVWAILPARVRRRASVATWAFAGENRFDLVALPRLTGIALDRSYLPPAALDAPEITPKPQPLREIRAPGSIPVAIAGLIIVGALTAAWIKYGRAPARFAPDPAAVALVEQDQDSAEAPLPPAEAARVRAGLDELAERFAPFEVGPASDPTQLLTRLADALHYHGRLLTPDERDTLAQVPDPDKARALGWHDQIQRFRDDQPWPGNFATLPLPRQLAAVARSFHLDPTLPAGSIPDALIDALARPGLVQATPLAARFPALSEYARFLGKLPRSDDPPASRTGR